MGVWGSAQSHGTLTALALQVSASFSFYLIFEVAS